MVDLLVWCFLIFILWTQYSVTESVSNLVDKTEHETVHFYRVPQNRSVPIGATVELECIPRSNVQYVIWYFQPVSRSIRSGPRKVIIAAHQPEPLELAMCQPDILCKEKHGLRGLTIQPSGKLIIYPVSFEHAGKYECAVVAGVHASRVHAHVFVETKPSIPVVDVVDVGQKLHGHFKEGDNVRLTCTCGQGFPLPQLLWLKKDAGDSDNSSTDYRLVQAEFMRIAFYTPTPVTPGAVQSGLMLNLSWFDHNTELVCKAVNPVGTEMSAPYRISVTFSPRIRPFRYNPWILIRDMSTELRCDVASHPSAVIQWIGTDGNQLSRSPFLDSALLLESLGLERISNIPSWRHNITCVAANAVGTAQRTLTVEIHCTSATKPHHWPSPILQINSITQDDAGTYRCVAENIVHESGGPPTQKRSEDFTTIYVYYPPKEPVVTAHFPSEMRIGVPLKLECHPNAASKLTLSSFREPRCHYIAKV
ncbi:hypothetical protein FBUS_04009 [Fasciolopsis buskii]|uniref:Ig-like domain-containing protein n=1 Tax=Fasciolopsis buskii TaxID=27845 RepID=A0A8E0S498_9TREM|nr:hypothetical protein FBUS_04009 [Fasciolopsis buski]